MDVKKKEEEKVEEEEEDDDLGVGPIEECQDIPKLNSLAGFVVDQHNKKENANLKFVEAINGKEEFVAGTLYQITLKAKDGEKVNVYEAKVWEQTWSNTMELCEFKLVGDASSVGC